MKNGLNFDTTYIYDTLCKSINMFTVCASCRNISLGVKQGLPCIRLTFHNNDHYVKYDSARDATQQYIILVENAISEADCELFLRNKSYDIVECGF